MIMRKQSWQVRLILLFYSAGIIKGLSNNNYAPRVDLRLSCSRCEWQRGVCAIGTTGRWEEMRAHECGECVCHCVCMQCEHIRGTKASQHHTTQKSPISSEHTAVNSKQNRNLPHKWQRQTNGGPPSRKSWLGMSEQAGNSRSWHLWGVELIRVPSLESMGDGLMHCDTGTLPRISCSNVHKTTIPIPLHVVSKSLLPLLLPLL